MLLSELNWKARRRTADLNGDGKADLLWNEQPIRPDCGVVDERNQCPEQPHSANRLQLADPGNRGSQRRQEIRPFWYNAATGQTCGVAHGWRRGIEGREPGSPIRTWRLQCIKTSELTSGARLRRCFDECFGGECTDTAQSTSRRQRRSRSDDDASRRGNFSGTVPTTASPLAW